MELKKTDKNINKLIEMANECNDYNGSHEWAKAYSLDEIDDILAGMKPSEILTKVYYGGIEDWIDYDTARIRFDAYENIQITNMYQIGQEAWDYQDEILEDYKEVVGEDEYEKAMKELEFEED